MTVSRFLSAESVGLKRSIFARRSLLPLGQDYLWHIETGVVRTLTWLEDGTTVTLGIWRTRGCCVAGTLESRTLSD